MRRPKGIKTRKSVAKRFKITANGKVLFRGAGRRHLLQGEAPNSTSKTCSENFEETRQKPRI